MADRRVKVNLDLDASGYEAGAKKAKGATDALGDAVDKTKQKNEQSQTSMQKLTGFVRENDAAMQTAGRSLVAVGVGLTGLAVGATKAAIDWESAWADVAKVNDGTSEQMQRLESDLREMARTIPATHEEIAATAEAAGRLGVEVDSVAEFTRVMIDLGNTTTLSADEAATAFARFTEIMGTGTDNVDRLGSAVTYLGNNFAATETEIVQMGLRIAGAGNQVGLAEAEVMALATALSAVGIDAQAGGSAISRIMIEIEAAVDSGSDSLEAFASAAGMSASDFQTAWQEDAAGALVAMVDGLANAEEQGTSTLAMLEEMGITELRTRDAMLRLAGSGEVLAEAFEAGNSAFAENTALQDEAAIRYETVAMRIKTAWSSVTDLFITAGAAIAPAVGDVVEMIGKIADTFASLPDPVIQGVTALSGVAGVSAIAAGGLLMLAPRAVETYDAFRRLATRAPGVVGVLGDMGKAAGLAAAAVAGLLIAREVADALRPATATVEEMTNALNQLNDSGDATDLNAIFDIKGIGEGLPWLTGYVDGIDDLGDALEKLDPEGPLEKFQAWSQETLKLPGPLKNAREEFETLDTALSQMDTATAAEHMRNLRDEAEAAGRQDFSNWEDLKRVLPDYAASVEEAATVTGAHVTDAELLEVAMGNLTPEMEAVKNASDEAAQQDALVGALEDVGVAADGTVDSLSDYLDMLFQTGLAAMSERDAHRAYQESLEGIGDAVDHITDPEDGLGGLSKALNKNKTDFDITTEAGKLAEASFQDLARSGFASAEAMAENGHSQESVQEALEGTYDDLLEAADAFGLTEKGAENLTREVLGIPPNVDIETWMNDEAQNKVDELSESLDEVPEGLDIITAMDDTARDKAFETGEAIEAITGYKKVDVAISEDGTAGQVQSKVDSITGKTEYVFVTEDGTTTTVQQKIINIDGVTRHVYVDDDGTVYTTQEQINGISGTSADVNVTDNGSASNVQKGINNIRGKSVTVTVTTKQVGSRIPKDAGGATGGRIGTDFGFQKLAGGGRLPHTGLGTDKILGVNALGMPLALVDDLEWVINRGSSDKYDRALGLINQDHPSIQHLAHLNNGGRAAGREWTANNVAPAATNVTVTAPPVDTSGIREEVRAGLAGATIQFNMAGRTFTGMVVEANNQAKSMGVR